MMGSLGNGFLVLLFVVVLAFVSGVVGWVFATVAEATWDLLDKIFTRRSK